MHRHISRREFSKRSAFAVLAAASWGATPKTETFELRYALGSSLYGTLKLEDVVAEAPKSGALIIDIWPKSHADHREQIEEMGHDRFAAILEKHKVGVGVLSHYDLGPFGLRPEMAVAKKFGARLIVTNSRGPKDLRGEELKREIKKFLEQIKPHLNAAGEHEVVIAIENHGGGLIASPDSIRWLVEMEKSAQLAIALAPYHLEQNPNLLADLIIELGERLALFYAWQHGKGSVIKLPKEQELLQMPGRGDLDFVPLVRALKKINFKGLTEIFMHPVPRGVPILDTAAEVTAEVNRARAYLESCLKKV